MKRKERKVLIEVTEREHTQILAGLRLWQADTGSRNKREIDDTIIADMDRLPLSDDELNTLCESVNCDALSNLQLLVIVQHYKDGRKPTILASLHRTPAALRTALDNHVIKNWPKHLTAKMPVGETNDNLAYYFSRGTWNKPGQLERETWHAVELPAEVA